MRPTLLIAMVSLITINHSTLKSQCTNNSSTNPKNAINTELDGVMLNLSRTTNEYINTFDWAKNDGNSFYSIPINGNAGWSPGILPTNPVMASPYSLHGTPSGYGYLNQGVTSVNDMDWHWEDGWELMWLGLGNYPNGEGIQTTNNTRINDGPYGPANPQVPYFVLYNRYTGKLRFFGNSLSVAGTDASNSVQLLIKHPINGGNNVSGVFRHVSGIDLPLDQATKHTYLSSNNPNPGNSNQWFSSDFQLGFDPCVCNYSSIWDLELQKITSWNAEYFSRGISQTLPVNSFKEKNFLTNTSIDLNDEGGGSLLFPHMLDMYEQYSKNLSLYNDRLAEYNKPENEVKRQIIGLAKIVVKDGVLGSTVPNAAVLNRVNSVMKNINEDFDPQNAKSMANAIRKTADDIITKDIDMLVEQFVGSNVLTKPSPPVMPMASFSESRIKGKVTKTNLQSITGVYNPGSFRPGNKMDPFSYPLWNKPVGLFALLRTPSVRVNTRTISTSSNGSSRRIEEDPMKWSNWEENGINLTTIQKKRERIFPIKYMMNYNYEQDIHFKVSKKLEYKLNHNLDIDFDKTNSVVSFEVILETDFKYKNQKLEASDPQKIDVSRTNLNLESHVKSTPTEKEHVVLTTKWEPLKTITNNLFGGRLGINAEFLLALGHKIQTEYKVYTLGTLVGSSTTTSDEREVESLNALDFLITENVTNPSGMNQLKFKIKSIKLRIMPEIYFKQKSSKGGELKTRQIFTYQLKDDDVDFIAEKGQWVPDNNVSDLVRYSIGTINLSNTIVDPSNQFVSSVIGTTININADDINLDGNISPAPGFRLHFNARNSINTGPSLNLSPLTELNIIKDFYNIGESTEATETDLLNFCTGQNKAYKANIAASAPAPENDDEDIKDDLVDNTKSTLSLTLFPNPNSGTFNLKFSKELEDNGTIRVTDLSGKLVYSQALEKGSNAYKISTKQLVNGIYIATIEANGQRFNNKIMVQSNY